MIDTLFLILGLTPLVAGLGLTIRPPAPARRQRGLTFVLIGTVLLLTWFHPVWIYNMFLVARVFAGLFFPQLFQPSASQVVPTVFI